MSCDRACGARAAGPRRRDGSRPGGDPRRLLLFAALLVSAVRPASAAPTVLPFGEVHAGMRGTGRTVFAGTAPETFEVEILGTLPDVGPGQDLILARLSGGPLERTGVMAGMSGSPVFVGERLVGAVAYSWGFSSEPIAGIVPIEELLAVSRASGGSAGRPGAVDLAHWRSPLESAAALRAFLEARQVRLAAPAGARGLPLPLAVTGIGAQGLGRIAPQLLDAGFLAQRSGASDPAAVVPALEPGSAIGVKLVRGDIDMTATGTLTWIENGELWAFGHPLLGLGSIDLPLTGARVEALLPSVLVSMRFATPTAEVGAARQDRSAGVSGVSGAEAKMIPVRLRLTSDGGERSFAFDVADDPLLSPLLLYYSLRGILAAEERAVGSATVRLAPGSVIQLLDEGDLELDNLFAGDDAFDLGTGVAAYLLHLMMNNDWSPSRVVGINLLLEYEDTPRTAHIRRATLDRYRVAPGDAVEVAVTLSPYRGADRVVRRAFVIPPETPPGRLAVSVGGALSVTREVSSDEPVMPRDLRQLIWLVNQLRRNDGVYIVVHREDRGVLLEGARLPSLPPSASALLGRPASQGNFAEVGQRAVLEEVIQTDHAIEGRVRLELLVEAP